MLVLLISQEAMLGRIKSSWAKLVDFGYCKAQIPKNDLTKFICSYKKYNLGDYKECKDYTWAKDINKTQEAEIGFLKFILI